MNKLKVLIIDDEKDLVDEIADSLKEEAPQLVVEGCDDFMNSIDKLFEFQPHLIILDLFEGKPSENDNRGTEVHEHIWENLFRPIVVYSAQPDLITTEHPLIKKVKKGQNGMRNVICQIKKLEPVIQAINEAEEHIKRKFAESLRDAAPNAYESLGSEHNDLTEIIVRTSRRRLAASMDQQTECANLEPWEIYLCPPIKNSSIQLGDILVKTESETDGGSANVTSIELDPSNYFIVLTPSCDLVESESQSPKVSKILVARCCGVNNFRAKTFNNIKENKFARSVRSEVLTPGHKNGYVPLPKFSNKIPIMFANLRDLFLIPVDDVIAFGSNHQYQRVGSIDSPFREMIAWVYSNFTSRPGLPDRNFEDMVNDLTTCAYTQDGEF